MSGQALQLELTSLAQEAKRKNPEIRAAAEKSLQDLKSLPSTSEQQLAADLSRRPNFVDPFLLACATRNPKYAASAANCLQRLVIIRGLPKSRLKDVLDAFNACTALSLDVQLKVLQALPALAQAYSDDLKGEQLAAVLQVCVALQNVKTATVSGVAAATLQQLLVSIFEKVASEDAKALEVPVVAEVPSDDGPVAMREAAYDAYRVFLDISLALESRKTRFVQLSNMNPSAGLELIWVCIDTHPRVFLHHPEQINIIRTVIMPFLIRVISERQNFSLTLRAIRVAALVIRRHLEAMPEECEVVLGLLTHMLDPEAATGWKRAMCMEVFRMIYTEPGLALQMYLLYDAKEGKRTVVRDNISTFVRLSGEKPGVIGLGQQSSIPTGPANVKESLTEQAIVEAEGGVAGVIGAALGVSGGSVPGISSQWSVPKSQCIDQLDKSEPPSLPETYIYSLVLECLNGLSENLAKAVLPLTVQHENHKPKNTETSGAPQNEAEKAENSTPPETPRTRRTRSQSYRSRTVPINPLQLETNSGGNRMQAIASLVEECWPALLATYSTFLNAALDHDYYRALIRSYQRFVQVSGLLRLSTARDAFLTTLGKAAVPPNVVSASMPGALTPLSETPTQSSMYSHGKGLLSMDSFASQTSTNEKNRRLSHDPARLTLTTRNLLCLRALLNVAIAIGPTLESSFTIIFETLQQAGVVLNTTNAARDAKTNTSIGPEVAAVEAAALRLFESTADYPNDAFLHVLHTLCKLLDGRPTEIPSSTAASSVNSPFASPRMSFSGRRVSGLPGLNTETLVQPQDYIFILTRLGELGDLNIPRFITYSSSESGWKTFVESLVDIGINAAVPTEARRLAADVLSRCSVSIAEASTAEDAEDATAAQGMALSSLRLLILKLYGQSDELTSVDIDIHAKVLDAVKLILENCGESLTAGWDTILAILSSVFDDEEEHEEKHSAVSPEKPEESWLHLTNQPIAPYLSRSAFGIMQFVCSDFLSALPETCFSPLIEILYRFASQESDLNISLTTITLFLDVSDFLVKQQAISGVNELSAKFTAYKLTYEQLIAKSKHSRPDQWLLALYRLADIVADPRSEVGSGAFQTLLRIFKNHADSLTPSSWQLCFETLIMKILREDAARHRSAADEPMQDDIKLAMGATSKALLEDSAGLVSENLAIISSSKSFDMLWSELLKLFQEYNSCTSAVVIAALYNGITKLLRALTAGDAKWKGATKEAALIWSSGIPAVQGESGEQDAYLAYADCIAETYRLTQKFITAEEIKNMALNLFEIICASSGVAYASDVNNTTPLQSKALQGLRMLRTDIHTVPSALIKIASTLVRLPYDEPPQPKPRTELTFVALSKASIDWLVELVTSHMTEQDIFASNSVARALEDLAVPLSRKYTWSQNGKSPAPWQKATPAALSIIEPALVQMPKFKFKTDATKRVWRAVVKIAHEIMHAHLAGVKPQPSRDTLEIDEIPDCASMMRLRDVVIPRLGHSSLPDSLRQTYVSSLFHASIIHALENNELPPLTGSPLTDIDTIRLGRVRDPSPTPREDMAYLCLRELISLTSKPNSFGGEEERDERVRLAQAAAPWLVLRLAIPIRAYVVDQPLRGSMPIPLSQVEELLFCLESTEHLVCEPSALLDEGLKVGGIRGERMHLRWLYPLVVRAAGVAGHPVHGKPKILEALQKVLAVAGRCCVN